MPRTFPASEDSLVQILTICLHLCVQSPDPVKQAKFIERDIVNTLDEDKQEVISHILKKIGISFGSPDQQSDDLLSFEEESESQLRNDGQLPLIDEENIDDDFETPTDKQL